MSQKPLSFTTKLIFYDKEGKQYPIFVAGTTDNCIFTNFTFFQRTERNSYEIHYDRDIKSINLRKKNVIEETTQKDNKSPGNENNDNLEKKS